VDRRQPGGARTGRGVGQRLVTRPVEESLLDISDGVDESVVRLYQAVEIRDLVGEVVAVLVGGLVAEADPILKGTGAVLRFDELSTDDGLDVKLVGCEGCVTIVSTLGVRREIVGVDFVNGAVVM